jgi:hypothetical protein
MTMTDFELSFQFPMKRDGASPVVLAGSVTTGVSSGAADSVTAGVSSGAADSVAAGVSVAISSLSLFELVITIAPTRRIPSRTAKRAFEDDLLLELVAGFEAAAGLALAAEVRGAAGDGVVETFTRDPPTNGTGGMTTCDAIFLRAADFFTVFFAVDFFAVDFLAVDFLATFFAVFFFTTAFLTALLGALFFAALFLAGDFFAVFLAVDFFGAAFFAADFFFTATVIS